MKFELTLLSGEKKKTKRGDVESLAEKGIKEEEPMSPPSVE